MEASGCVSLDYEAPPLRPVLKNIRAGPISFMYEFLGGYRLWWTNPASGSIQVPSLRSTSHVTHLLDTMQ